MAVLMAVKTRFFTLRYGRTPSPFFACGDGVFSLVELRDFEPLTFSLRTRRATNCAIAPDPMIIHHPPPECLPVAVY